MGTKLRIRHAPEFTGIITRVSSDEARSRIFVGIRHIATGAEHGDARLSMRLSVKFTGMPMLMAFPYITCSMMDGALFVAWIRDFLCPTLRPGDIVTADNLSSHKVAGVEEALAAVGACIQYLPPYSSNLNPIEKLFAKLKAMLRKAAKRTVDALWDKLGKLLDTISPQGCEHYFKSCGYVSM